MMERFECEDKYRSHLAGVGPVTGQLYTGQETIDLLIDMEQVIKDGISNYFTEYVGNQQIMKFLRILAEEKHIDNSETFKRFDHNMNDLGYTIASYIKGKNGEKIARKALKLIGYDRDVKIIYNLNLKDGDTEAEYDAVVITTYGLFIIEVKNWSGDIRIDDHGLLSKNNHDDAIVYDLAGRMSIKEALLREYLGDEYPGNYYSILLFPNEKTTVNDEYGYIPYCYGAGISYDIRKYRNKNNTLNVSVSRIEQLLFDHHEENKSYCKVDCEAIREDYAKIMAAIEMDVLEEKMISEGKYLEVAIESEKTRSKDSAKHKDIFGYISIVASTCTSAFLAGYAVSKVKKYLA